MTYDSHTLLNQIQHDFRFLVDDYGFTVTPSPRSGEAVQVQYQHPVVVIQFNVRHGEWQALAWPADPQQQAQQVKLDDVLTYLTRPPVDFAADQARPGLTQSEALAALAQQLDPIAAPMLALFDPARWPAVWVDMQTVLQARSAERSRQFMRWWQNKKADGGDSAQR